MRSWYAEGESELEWTGDRHGLLEWMLHQPKPGWLGLALLRMQAGAAAFTPVSLPRMLQNLEMSVLTEALSLSEGNIAEAARLTGLNRTTLSARVKQLGLMTGEPPKDRVKLVTLRTVVRGRYGI